MQAISCRQHGNYLRISRWSSRVKRLSQRSPRGCDELDCQSMIALGGVGCEATPAVFNRVNVRVEPALIWEIQLQHLQEFLHSGSLNSPIISRNAFWKHILCFANVKQSIDYKADHCRAPQHQDKRPRYPGQQAIVSWPIGTMGSTAPSRRRTERSSRGRTPRTSCCCTMQHL